MATLPQTSNAGQDPGTTCKFLELPTEIRNMIWEYILPMYYPIMANGRVIGPIIDPAEDPQCPWFVPEICYLSCQIKDETAYMLIRDHTLIIAHAKAEASIRIFLNSIPGRFNAVRKLQLGSMFPYHKYEPALGNRLHMPSRTIPMNLAVDCPGLTHVDILLVSPHDIGFIHTQLKSAWAVQNVNQLLDKSDLHKLVWCDKLQDIRFLHRYDLHEEYGKRRHEELALVRDVIRWLEDAFRWKNPNRHIVICDLGWLPRRNQLDEFAALSSE